MIPADLTARLRMLTEASFFQADQPVHALDRVKPISGDLPEFTPGQRITATIDRALPDGQFSALVAGKTVTLALPSGLGAEDLQPGRTLELEVTRNTPQAVHAQLAQPEPEPRPALSQTGRLISILLTGQQGAEPATLAAGKPLLAAPPASAAPLVPALQQALTQSGLFYESHQAQWIAGKLGTADLRQEPQGQIPVAPAGPNAQATRPEAFGLPPESPLRPIPESSAAVTAEGATPGAPAQSPQATATAGTGAIPDRLLPVVGQQLDALATQQFAWQGQVWPGQTMEWQIEDPGGGQGEGVENQTWNTTLRLTLPRLGSVEARLQLTAGGVGVRLLASEAPAQAELAAAREALARGLDAARVPLLGLTVEPSDGQP